PSGYRTVMQCNRSTLPSSCVLRLACRRWRPGARRRTQASLASVRRLEDLSRVEDVVRVERRLEPAHHLQRGAVLGGHVGGAADADAVLARGRPAEREREAVDLVGDELDTAHLIGV